LQQSIKLLAKQVRFFTCPKGENMRIVKIYPRTYGWDIELSMNDEAVLTLHAEKVEIIEDDITEHNLEDLIKI